MTKGTVETPVSVRFIDSPIGKIGIAESGNSIVELFFGDASEDTVSRQGKHAVMDGAIGKETPLLRKAASQLEEYFNGKRRVFELPLSLQGTRFQMAVWNALQTIPYGETRSYKQIAEQIGNPKAYRAVGMANNRNPISIIVPCHRVIGHDGSMVGYGGGMMAKEFLLRLETSHDE